MAYITIAELRAYLGLYDADTYTPAFGADTLTLDTVAFAGRLKTGMPVLVSSTTADPPAPLAEDTVYYVILTADQVIQLASTSALALAGTQINLTDNGTGTHTITLAEADTLLLYDAISGAETYIESQTKRQFSKSIEYHALAGADTLVLADTDVRGLFPTAAPVTVESSLHDPPAPLAEDTVYYVIEVSGEVLQLATTAALAVAGTQIDITDTGTGTHIITRLETRYYDRSALDRWDNRLLNLLDDDLLTVTTLTNGDSSATTITAANYWLIPRNLGPPYHGILLRTDISDYWEWDTDCYVSVLGTWGYTRTPPRDIRIATLHLAAFYYRQKDSQIFDVTAIPEAGVITIPQGIPATVSRIIEHYKKQI